jgi:DNA invertase Pin-like site-specific DNA recombinase
MKMKVEIVINDSQRIILNLDDDKPCTIILNSETSEKIMSKEHQKLLQDGRQQAKKRGVRLGRRPSFSKKVMQEIFDEYNKTLNEDGRSKTVRQLVLKYKVSRSTICRIIAKVRSNLKPPVE